ncbi:MAG: hypothetical protein A2X61_15625 [Ignavibacteria bacterium GWB2_35_12]|nr:MAG: hypothetical protein A2X63_04950 [Ignavibacteria bacterium GWA2_35_8]OGU40806.1 MAG: hypothetical protein A2X61_15625 [Ignavibacteria bacterium GWB2_35_12]OGU90320.1 MAG: hypothetical protein A2220_10850 [Ignavibacteria bacterium RIFOXYA2_FULL_35_10]OGV24633.1 MAG: hypothetical protein A2475_14400 [Ignavibacteria bacterium RIFOXYC2_FULL_35_21]
MPTVLRIGNMRFHFYSDEYNEPPDIHIEPPDGECKFWLVPIRLSKNNGIKPHDVRIIEKHIFENDKYLIEKYYEFHNISNIN